MTDILLGVVAVSVTVIAVTQVILLVAALRAATQLQELVRRLDAELRPLLAQVRTIADDLARTSALAATQVERVDEMTSRLAGVVGEATSSLSHGVLAPLRDGMALVRGVMAAVAGVRRVRRPRRAADAAESAGDVPRAAADADDAEGPL